MPGAIYAIATLDTKGEELAFVAECVRGAGGRIRVVDVSTSDEPSVACDVRREDVAAWHPDGAAAVLGKSDRGEAITAMAAALEAFLVAEHARDRVAGVVGLGGSGGTALIAPAMRALPIGLPKLLVSTVASGDTEPYVGTSDITLMYSVVDVAGLNAISRRIFSNAAHAIAGMVAGSPPDAERKPTVALTMFGVTTPCVDAARHLLEEEGYDCLVFHATGTGGRAMEKLVASGMIDGVLDITTTEVADEVVGGIFPAGPQRFDALVHSDVPWVLSAGALDMVNFQGLETVPRQFQQRNLHVHNAQITLMRTTPQENEAFGQWIGKKLALATRPIVFLIPGGGVSALDAPGQPFHDADALAAFGRGLEASLGSSSLCQVRRSPHHINDREFARELVNTFLTLARGDRGREPRKSR